MQSATAVLLKAIVPLTFRGDPQALRAEPPRGAVPDLERNPAVVHQLSVPYELDLEFELFYCGETDGKLLLLGKSHNGKLMCSKTSAHLTQRGKDMCLYEGPLYSKFYAVMKGMDIDPGLQLHNTRIQFHSRHSFELCADPHTVPMMVEFFNVWQQSYVIPFGLVTRWAFLHQQHVPPSPTTPTNK